VARPYCVGLAGANAPLEMARRPTGARGAVAHDDVGSAALVARLQAVPPTLLGRAATGGDQRAVVAALAAAGRPVAVGHPRQARDGANAPGPWATTAARDATAVAHGAEAGRPPPRPRRAARDDALDTTRRTRPVWRARAARRRRVPGGGPVSTRTRRLERPAWGTLSRQRRAAVVGVAPLHRERGTLRGRRTSWGGRAQGRAARSRSTLVAGRDHAGRQVVDERWRAAGKAATVALPAGRRQRWTILNARVTQHQPWHVQEGPSASYPRPP
jgi:transposase